jgi:sugar/nucleoside kinase (ribokinase family)
MTGRDGLPAGKASLLVVGDIAWDIVIAPEEDLIWGSDVDGPVQLLPGGSAANVAVWARREGSRVRLVGKIGDDGLGKLMRMHLVEQELDAGITTVPGGSTTRIAVLVSPRGERAFVTDHESLIGFEPDDCPVSLLDGMDGLFFNGYGLFASKSPAFLSPLLAEARRRHVLIAFDPSSFALIDRYGPKRLIQDIGPVDAVFANEAEAASLSQGRPPSSLLTWSRMVILKQGRRGATVIEPDGSTAAPGHSAAVVDTTGAGDAFAGAFLAAHLSGATKLAALQRANRCGAYVAGRRGAQPSGMPEHEGPARA